MMRWFYDILKRTCHVKNAVLLIGCCILSGFAFASTDPVIVSKLEGNTHEILVNAERETIDPVYYSAQVNDIDNPANDVYRNVIALLIGEDNGKFITADFTVTIVVEITWTDKNGTQQNPIQKTLEINYKIAEGTKYNARNYFYFDNARKVKMKVISIDIHGATWDATEVLVLENRMEVKRDYKFSCNTLPLNVQAQPGETSPDNKIDELNIGWYSQAFKGITHYDIEWTWVDFDALDRYQVNNQYNADLLFRNNSSRVTKSALNPGFKVPLIYDGHGFLFYRVRPVQYREDGQIIEGKWSDDENSNITYYEYTNGHEPDLNWQVSTTYAEDGKRKTVISYFDGTLRSRQTVTKDNVNNTTVVAETFYDYQGRPAINVLPSPTLNNVITYVKNFNRFAASGNPKDIYDLVPTGQTICTTNTPVLDNNYGTSQYYSPNSPILNGWINDNYIPDAEGYPYTETRYTPDATGRIASQGGVGPDYQLGAGKHATNYYYGYADQHELNALFGTEVGEQSHYFKNMVKDGNGQFSVSYVDMHGRTIATALAGTPPDNLTAMSSYQTQTMTRNLLSRGNNIVKDRSIESATTLLVPKAGPHAFHYELTPQSAEIIACNPTGQTVCYDCYYDLEIRITGTCGQAPVVITRRNFTFGTYDVSCGTPPPGLVVDETYQLEEGEYNITKKLTLSKDAQDWYRENLFTQKNICKTLQQFINENYQVLLSTSNCGMTCASCNAALGTYAQFRTKFLQQLGVNPSTTVPYENQIDSSYKEAKANCEALCNAPESKLSLIRELMLQDVTPHQGQYAKLNVDLDGDGDIEPGVFINPTGDPAGIKEWEINITRPYNIFNNAPPKPGYLPGIPTPYFRRPFDEKDNTTHYKNEFGQPDQPTTPSLSTIIPDDFSDQFGSNWPVSLIYYHPEYCKLKKAEQYLVNSYKWDATLEKTSTWQAAVTGGYTGSANNMLNLDPFFSGVGNSYRTAMLNYMTVSYKNNNSMWKLAIRMVNCLNNTDTSCGATIAQAPPYSAGTCTGDWNNVWRIFRAMYLTEKDKMVNQYLDQQCGSIDYAQLKDLGYERRFGHYDNYYGIYLTNLQNILSGNGNGQTLQGIADAGLLAQYTLTCESYIDMWKARLLQCDQIASHAQKEQILTAITNGMKDVCIWGSDEYHVFGSSTLAPSDPRTPKSFEEVITTVLGNYSISISALCNKYLVDFPQPYKLQQPISDEVVVNPKDSCMCARLKKIKDKKSDSGYSGTLSQYIQYAYGVYMSPGLLDTLSGGCGPTSTCNTYDPPLTVPGILGCGAIQRPCITCDGYTSLKDQFIQEFPGFTVIYADPDTDDKLNKNLAFERFMNIKTGFRKSWGEYLQFELACATYNQAWTCTRLDSIVTVFEQTYPTAGWGSTCEQLFTQFFNQAFGTFYTFADIQVLFLQYCGEMPDVCRPVLDCTAFKQRIAAFYVQYGNTISGSPTCQQLFTNYFNSYYGSSYSWGEIDNLHQTVCGYSLDVCTPLSAVFLQQVLDNWHNSYPGAWLQTYTDCENQWVAYFNAHAFTSLSATDIAQLYSNYSLTMDPCFPAGVTCNAIDNYLTSYNNLGNAACDSSGLDPQSSGFCEECFAWYMNHILGTSYTYEEFGLMFDRVCGSQLDLCAFRFNCEKLSGLAADFLSTGYEGNCQDAFKDYFNLHYNLSLGFEQIMNLYQFYCGHTPGVCGAAAITTCEQLTTIKGNFLDLYPDPGAVFGQGCQAAFANYFNMQTGDTLTYQQIMNYYSVLCGEIPEICSTNCGLFQSILDDYVHTYGNYPMPQQLCRDLFVFYVNRQLEMPQGSELNWQQVAGIYSNCGIPLNICQPDGMQLLACDRLEGARNAYYGFHPEELPKNCEQEFVIFFNFYFHTAFTSIEDLSIWTMANCDVDLRKRICGDTDPIEVVLPQPDPPQTTLMPPTLCDAGPMFPSLQPAEDSCGKHLLAMALYAGTEQYNIYIKNKKDDFDKAYTEKCLAAAPLEIFTVTATVAEYHYTLYYYDQAGSLVKTVPPAGVNPDFSTTFYNSVETARANVMNGQPLSSNIVVPSHTLVTQYRYNTLGQVVQQKSPDGGLSKYFYDKLGRLVISRNAKQANGNRYSYTKYDALGRIAEVGQISGTTVTQELTQNPTTFQDWLDAGDGSRQQITATVYDLPKTELCVPAPSLLCQQNLRNRVSYTYVQPDASFSNNGLPYSTATYYTYDIHGNVDVLLQHYNDGIMQTVAGNAFKRMEYKYDLVSGKVNEVAYQPGVKDQFYHRYEYDAENKLIKAETSPDYVYWQQQASYSYYRHGPLARVEIGQLGVQGVDYVYTLQGWLKGVNSTSGGYDAGGDGMARVARDAYGFSLNYNSTDYKPVFTGLIPFADFGTLPQLNADGVNTGKDLYNGNIRAMLVNIPKLGDAKLYGYRYDQLNRITAMNAYSGLNEQYNTFTPTALADYKERISYDANGNILSYLRNGTTANSNPLAMDNLSYNYYSGSNKLSSVNDAVTSGNYSTDIDNQGTNNYDYDEIGNLIKDNAEGITSITWTVYGKIKTINKTGGVTINYEYDASGNRISKNIGNRTTFYVRDASGNVMAIYENDNSEINNGKLSQIEVDLYGSSRLGSWQRNLDVESTNWWLFETTAMPGTSNGGATATIIRGNISFELSNHLGNVLVTVSDRKIQVQDPNEPDFTLYYKADVLTATDYYPFGMMMPQRKYEATSGYRYGFNGMEKDNDIKGNGNNYTTEFREYDPRVARWLSMDPASSKYPNQSPYAAFNNNPLFFTDPHGDDPPEGFKKHLAANGMTVYLPDLKKIIVNYNEGEFDPAGGEVIPGSVNSFSIGNEYFKSKYSTKGEFLGYFDSDNAMYDPSIYVEERSGFSGPNLIRMDIYANIDGIHSNGIKVVQLCSTTPFEEDINKKYKFATHLPLDDEGFIKGQYIYEVNGERLAGEVDGGKGSYTSFRNGKVSDISGPYLKGFIKNTGYGAVLQFSDAPAANQDVQKMYFKTMIVASSYMGTGEDLVLWSRTWGFTGKGKKPIHGSKFSKEQGEGATELDQKIVNTYYPNFKFW